MMMSIFKNKKEKKVLYSYTDEYDCYIKDYDNILDNINLYKEKTGHDIVNLSYKDYHLKYTITSYNPITPSDVVEFAKMFTKGDIKVDFKRLKEGWVWTY